MAKRRKALPKRRTVKKPSIKPVKASPAAKRRISISSAEGGFILNVSDFSSDSLKEKKVVASSEADLVRKLKENLK